MIAGLISILFIVIVTYSGIVIKVRRDVYEKNILIVNLARGEIQRYLDEMLTPVEILRDLWVEDFSFGRKEAISEKYMKMTLDRDPILQQIVVVNEKNKIEMVYPPDRDLLGNDMSGHSYVTLQNESSRQLRWSDTFISGKTGNPSVAVILPMGSRTLIAYIDLAYLNQIVKKMAIGKTGMAFIIDRKGTLIAHPDTRVVQERVNITELGISHPELIVEQRTRVISTADGDKIVSASFLAPGGWTIFFVQDTKEAFADLYRAFPSFLIGLVVYTLLAFLLGNIFVQRTVRPIMKLSAAAKNAAKGEYRQVRVADSYTEIDELRDSFATMVDAVLSREAALIENERMLSTLLSNLPGMAYRCVNDENWTMVFLSDGVRELTGYEADELLLNKVKAYGDLIHEEDRLLVYKQIQDSMTRDNTFELVYRIYHKDGSIKWLWEKGRPIYKGTRPLFIEGFVTDITELKEKDKQIQNIQKIEILGELAGGLAHDFNNVLGGISGTLSIMKLKRENEIPMDEKEVRRYVQTIENAIERASSIVQELLTLSQQKEPVKEKLDFSDVLHNVVRICENTLDKSITFTTELYPGPVIIEGDKTQLEQVLLNLCINASHAMTIMKEKHELPGGVLTLTAEPVHLREEEAVRHGRREGEPMAMISVEDTGVGMDPETAGHIFEPFFTTKQRYQGTGLGLAMADSIVKRHNGFLSVESQKGKGSRFTLYLPLLLDHPDVRTARPHEEAERIAGHGEGILLVDDETIIRETLKEIIEIHGFRVFTASDGEEAVRIYQKERAQIKLVIMDMLMPRLSGEEAFIRMKKMNPEVKVVLASGFKKDERISRTLKRGAVGFLQKPVDLKNLFTLIQDNIP
jgi:PAS domain S-box-containing protein